MKIIIASTVVPFVEGGGTFIVDWLEEMLRRQGHQVDTLRIPFYSWYPEMLDQMMALRLFDITNHGDRLIAIRTPSYLLRHPHKVLWFLHHHRTAYDLWGSEYQEIPTTAAGLRYRDAMFSADNLALRESQKVFTISRTVTARLKAFNQVNSEVLYPPVLTPNNYHSKDYGDYVLYVSRLVPHKRQHLAVMSMRYVKTPVRLVIAGKCGDKDPYHNELVSLIDRYNLKDKVTLISDWISDERKVELFAGSLASLFIAFDEDFGFPTVEAHHAKKCVITTTDSGGAAELVNNGENGFVVGPDPKEIAEAMDKLYRHRQLARDMGEAGMHRLETLGITWENTLARLLS